MVSHRSAHFPSWKVPSRNIKWLGLFSSVKQTQFCYGTLIFMVFFLPHTGMRAIERGPARRRSCGYSAMKNTVGLGKRLAWMNTFGRNREPKGTNCCNPTPIPAWLAVVLWLDQPVYAAPSAWGTEVKVTALTTASVTQDSSYPSS